MSPFHTVVVVPTYNERATMATVTHRLLRAAPVDLLVVDDASPDGTGAIADGLAASDARVHVLHRTAKRGLGSAYLAGFAWALERGYDAVGEMDADLSHDPGDVPRLLDALRGSDMVIGSRYVPGGAVHAWPLSRVLLSRGGNAYVRLLTGIPVADATAGFRLYRRSLLEALDLGAVRAEGYAFQLDMALRAWRAGLRIVEVPITFTERTDGTSKMSRAIVAEALWRVLVWGFTGPRAPAQVHPTSVGATRA
jgi:glycosyltransferase involved in cell wall biosynthesis